MNAPADLAAIKTRQQAAWAQRRLRRHRHDAADRRRDRCARRSTCARASACSTWPPATATRRSPRRAAACDVTSTDYVPRAARARRAARRRRAACDVDLPRVADAEALPFDDASFDVVLSTFGVMFTPDQRSAAARDAARVPAGRPDRPGQLDARRLHRPALQDASAARAAAGRASQSPALWGTRARLARAVRRAGARRSTPSRACSRSATARRRTGSTSSAAATARCTRRSPRSTPRRRPRARARPDRTARPLQPRGRRLAGRAERVPRGRRRYPALRMEARVQQRVQRYERDLAAHDYEPWAGAAGAAQADLLARVGLRPASACWMSPAGRSGLARGAARSGRLAGSSRHDDLSGRMVERREVARVRSRSPTRKFERMDVEALAVPGPDFHVALGGLGLMYGRSWRARCAKWAASLIRWPPPGSPSGASARAAAGRRCSTSSTPRSKATSVRCSSAWARATRWRGVCADEGLDEIGVAPHRGRPSARRRRDACNAAFLADLPRWRGRASTTRRATGAPALPRRDRTVARAGRGLSRPGRIRGGRRGAQLCAASAPTEPIAPIAATEPQRARALDAWPRQTA